MSSSVQCSTCPLCFRVVETNNTTTWHPVEFSHPSSEVCDIFVSYSSSFFFFYLAKKKTKHNKTRKWRIMIDVSILLMQSYHFLNERKIKLNQSKFKLFSCHILLLDANWSGSPNRSGYERLTFNADVYCNGCFNKRSSSWRNCASFRWTSFVLACLAFSISL